MLSARRSSPGTLRLNGIILKLDKKQRDEVAKAHFLHGVSAYLGLKKHICIFSIG